MAVKMFDRDLSKAEMSESLDDVLQLLGVLETVLTSKSADIESCRDGLLYITRDIDERVAHVLESLEAEDGKAE